MKRKQIIVLGLVLVIIAVGILQYNYGGVGESAKVNGLDGLSLAQGTDLEDVPGAAVYVNNGDKTDEALAQAQQKPTGFFSEARLERDKARSKEKEELKAIAEGNEQAVAASVNLTSSEAQEQLVAVIRRCEAESTIETLIKQRGFEDALVYMSDTGNVDVMVKASSLSAQDVAKISDIVLRHSEATMENITVKNVN
ncbi:MAG: SpoIIIAH-like family protein [Clostridia bacterium]|nr:SpoIIIAH-like family protein [Clostridia bacterium]